MKPAAAILGAPQDAAVAVAAAPVPAVAAAPIPAVASAPTAGGHQVLRLPGRGGGGGGTGTPAMGIVAVKNVRGARAEAALRKNKIERAR